MSGISAIALEKLLARQKLPDFFGSEAVKPSYDGLGLANIASLAIEWLSPDAPTLSEEAAAPAFNPKLLATSEITQAWESWQNQAPINHVVLLILDGFGYEQLQTLADSKDAPTIAEACDRPQGFFMPATSVYPSTTVTALTSAATGYAPAQHGMMGTNLYMREIGTIVNFIGFRPQTASTNTPLPDTQFNPETLIRVPNIYLRMEKAGIDVEIINFYQFKHTSISRFTSAGSEAGNDNFKGYLTPSDAFAQLRERLLTKSSQQKSFTYLYVPTIDAVSHRYGPLSSSYKAEVAALDFALKKQLLEPLAGRNDTVLLLTADHGQRYNPLENTLWLEEHPELTQNLFAPITGESRIRYLHIKHNQQAAVVDYIKHNFSENFFTITPSEAMELGLFGIPGKPLSREAEDRIGDLLLISHKDWTCRQHITNEERYKGLLGIHAGLSRAEMLIPFLAYRF
ncbi:alkaline phosphatase family protein [Rivularia sp. UHCC 0363]|uniref:alkaline phosphatase family protein n=1 Tax=Rivularia sp. UHCC 0363 TaxID=3110244 RepID=UPI002B218719|nr:alkaline phosphatase family protein [Rivularia sp. UHCC 0363]MEA5595056.1 alkaline phosphatase family protein [Rivularia sp. UHCC 0363]